jgi:hypothetical protein
MAWQPPIPITLPILLILTMARVVHCTRLPCAWPVGCVAANTGSYAIKVDVLSMLSFSLPSHVDKVMTWRSSHAESRAQAVASLAQQERLPVPLAVESGRGRILASVKWGGNGEAAASPSRTTWKIPASFQNATLGYLAASLAGSAVALPDDTLWIQLPRGSPIQDWILQTDANVTAESLTVDMTGLPFVASDARIETGKRAFEEWKKMACHAGLDRDDLLGCRHDDGESSADRDATDWRRRQWQTVPLQWETEDMLCSMEESPSTYAGIVPRKEVFKRVCFRSGGGGGGGDGLALSRTAFWLDQGESVPVFPAGSKVQIDVPWWSWQLSNSVPEDTLILPLELAMRSAEFLASDEAEPARHGQRPVVWLTLSNRNSITASASSVIPTIDVWRGIFLILALMLAARRGVIRNDAIWVARLLAAIKPSNLAGTERALVKAAPPHTAYAVFDGGVYLLLGIAILWYAIALGTLLPSAPNYGSFWIWWFISGGCLLAGSLHAFSTCAQLYKDDPEPGTFFADMMAHTCCASCAPKNSRPEGRTLSLLNTMFSSTLGTLASFSTIVMTLWWDTDDYYGWGLVSAALFGASCFLVADFFDVATVLCVLAGRPGKPGLGAALLATYVAVLAILAALVAGFGFNDVIIPFVLSVNAGYYPEQVLEYTIYCAYVLVIAMSILSSNNTALEGDRMLASPSSMMSAKKVR